ncbi:MAG TPA: DUF4199 domain-containing protein [Mucilaginibacter sp.]|nr:DUF4199 domain-containing protein [Mucilaginibacter sp.]
MSDSLNQKIKKRSIISGLVLGVVLLALSIASFYLIISATANVMMIIFSPILFSVLLPVVVVLLFCFDLRKRIGGYWTFRQAVSGIFIMFLVSYMIQVLGRDMLFARVIEPDMMSKTQAAMVRATTELAKRTGANQAAVAQKQAEIQKQFEDQKNITMGGILQGYIFTIMFLFIFALAFAALFRRNPPEYMPPVSPDE